MGRLYIYFKFINPDRNTPDHWLLGISPEGIGTMGMALNFTVAWLVAIVTPPPPEEIRALVDDIRVPRGSGTAHEIAA